MEEGREPGTSVKLSSQFCLIEAGVWLVVNWFPVFVGLWQAALSLVRFTICMDGISWRSQWLEGLQFSKIHDCVSASLQIMWSCGFTQPGLLLCSGAVCNQVWPSWDENQHQKVVCPLLVGRETLPEVEEFKYLQILLPSEGRREDKIKQVERCSVCSDAIVVQLWWGRS